LNFLRRSFHSGSDSELITEGGELGFVRKILTESLQLRNRIEIYSTMLGCKKNLQKLIDDLRANKIESFLTKTLVQGKTMRWGIVWSFKHNFKYFKNHNDPSEKSNNVLSHLISLEKFKILSNKTPSAYLREIFDNLKIEIKELKNTAEKFHQWELTATKNTWSNQRRKRREKAEQTISKNSETLGKLQNNSLKMGFEIKDKKDFVQLQMFYISGTMDKDCVHQIMQFIKNKTK
jgi:U6 snRNA m6A methyltransferase